MKKIKRSKRLDKNTRRVSGFFLTPSILGVLTFFVVPFFVVIYYSFVDNPINGEFVGFQNYVNVIQNQAFRTAVGNTLFADCSTACHGAFYADGIHDGYCGSI